MLAPTLSEMFAYDDWAHGKVLTAAEPLSDQQLDHKFEMGMGSIRATLNHLWAAERVWLDRWIDAATAKFHALEPAVTVADLRHRFQRIVGDRTRALDSTDIERSITFTNSRGETHTQVLRDQLMHVCVHSTHHRAQVINMLRHVGAAIPKPSADYIFMRIENPEPGVWFDVRTLRDFFAFSDWARARLHAAAADLADAQLDQPFEMGVGTLRKTLAHIRDAEQWWYDNWTQGPGKLFPAPDEKASVPQIGASFDEIVSRRNDLLAKKSDNDLGAIVRGTPRPNVERAFPVGVTMLQLCHHGTHHRAQAVNMVRRVGGKPPGVDFLAYIQR